MVREEREEYRGDLTRRMRWQMNGGDKDRGQPLGGSHVCAGGERTGAGRYVTSLAGGAKSDEEQQEEEARGSRKRTGSELKG